MALGYKVSVNRESARFWLPITIGLSSRKVSLGCPQRTLREASNVLQALGPNSWGPSQATSGPLTLVEREVAASLGQQQGKQATLCEP